MGLVYLLYYVSTNLTNICHPKLVAKDGGGGVCVDVSN